MTVVHSQVVVHRCDNSNCQRITYVDWDASRTPAEFPPPGWTRVWHRRGGDRQYDYCSDACAMAWSFGFKPQPSSGGLSGE